MTNDKKEQSTSETNSVSNETEEIIDAKKAESKEIEKSKSAPETDETVKEEVMADKKMDPAAGADKDEKVADQSDQNVKEGKAQKMEKGDDPDVRSEVPGKSMADEPKVKTESEAAKTSETSAEEAGDPKDEKEVEPENIIDTASGSDADESGDLTEVEAEVLSGKEAEKVTKQNEEAAEADLNEPEKSSEAEKSESDSSEKYYSDLAEKAESLLSLADWSMATMEFDNINHLWKQGPDPEGADIQPYREKIDTSRDQLEEKKREHYELQLKIRRENLGKKKDLLKDFQKIIEEKKWTHTRDVARIRNKWEQIKPIPAEEEEKLEESFTAFMETFDEHKVDRLVKQKQQEEDNLTIKLVILEKLEEFLKGVDDQSDWKELDKKLSEFVKQFRKIGRIPSEKNQEVWDRFYKAQDTFHSMRFKYDTAYRKEIEKNLSKKKKLIDEAEALIDADDLAAAARKVNKLHRRWKKIGNLPQKDENEMWDRFKAATDAFNEKKSENIDELREQEEQNYSDKLKLIDQAISIQDSEEWEETHKAYQKLMDQWKKTGPVSRRKSGKIWKKFKGAMDHFYDRRRDHFKEIKEERKDNLKDKEEIISKLKELGDHDNPVEAVDLAKPLQEEFKKAGYVPIKHKNRLWKEYREICDTIYERFRAAKSAVEIVGKENISQFSTDDLAEIKKKQDNANKIYKQISKLNSDLIQMKESISYFKPAKGGSSILDDAKKRIEDTEKEVDKLEKQLQKTEVEIDKLKKGN